VLAVALEGVHWQPFRGSSSPWRAPSSPRCGVSGWRAPAGSYARPSPSAPGTVARSRRRRGTRRRREVPCTIQVIDDGEGFLVELVENLHHQQLSGAERVRAIERVAATGLGVREMSRRTGFDPSTILRWLGHLS
jgi:hypothetical protein